MIIKKLNIAIVLLLLYANATLAEESSSAVIFDITKNKIELLVINGETIKKGMVAEVYKSNNDGSKTAIGTWTITSTSENKVIAIPLKVSEQPRLGQSAILKTIAPKKDPIQNTTTNQKPTISTTKQQIKKAPPVNNKPKQKTTKKNLSSTDLGLIDKIKSNKDESIRDAAKNIYHNKYNDNYVLDTLADVLNKNFNLQIKNKIHVDAMAWSCRALGKVGNKNHIQILKTVSQDARSRKVRKFARKNYKILIKRLK